MAVSSGLAGIISVVKKLMHKNNEEGSSWWRLEAGAVVRSSKPKAPRKGYVPVYVGEEEKRYEVPVEYVNFPELVLLMKRPGEKGQLEERIYGPLGLYCSIQFFHDLILKLDASMKKKHRE